MYAIEKMISLAILTLMASDVTGFTGRSANYCFKPQTSTNTIQGTTIWSPLVSYMVTSTSTTDQSRPTKTKKERKKKKSIRDRTQTEAIDLINDLAKAGLEAGSAAPARTFQAYGAFLSTIRDFSPLQPNGKQAETFSLPKVIRTLFERLGATYIKLGQFIASSPTLFPAEYVLEFQKCLDQTTPLEWNVIKQVIETEIGPISDTFSYIDKTPLASASIAQVHRATLKSNGEEVVIKVQKPGIDVYLKADLNFIYIASRTLEYIQPDFERTSLSGIASDIKSSMLEELDFEKEARNVEEFRFFLSDNDLLGVATAPKIYREHSTKKVLTMEFLQGVSLLDTETIASITDNNPEIVIITALNVWTQSVMSMPWFHADVHAGNLLVLNDGRVGFIDFGIVGRVSDKTFSAVNEMSVALSVGDYRGMAEALCNMGATDEEVDVDKFGIDLEALLAKMTQVQPDIAVSTVSNSATLGFDENEITGLLLEMVDVAEDNGLKLPREFGLLVKQSLYFDRYLKILAPGIDVVTDDRIDLRRVSGEMVNGLNGDEATEVIIEV